MSTLWRDNHIGKLGFPKLKKVTLDNKGYSVYHKKNNKKGNVYAWNSHAIKDIPKNLEIVSFYVEDWRFVPLLKSTKKAFNHLRKFQKAIQPDYSVYYDLDLMDQVYRTYIGKMYADIWSRNGFTVVPSLVLGSKELLPFATYGIAKGSTIAVQIQAHSGDTSQDKVDEWTIKEAIEIIKPKNILVYGTNERIKALHLENTDNIMLVETVISNLRKNYNGKSSKQN